MIRYSYSAANDLIMLVDGKNQTNRWEFDQYGRVTNQIDATSASIIQYTYDPEGRLTNRWTAAKGNTTYRYDQAGNLTNVVHAVSSNFTFAYDALNRVTNMVDGVGTTTYSYTTNGLLQSEDGPWAYDTVWYAHNTNGLRSSMTISNVSGAPWQVTYAYDNASRMSNIVSAAGTFTYTYKNASSLIKKLSLGNSSYITNTFDSMGRLLSTQLRNSGNQILNSHAYAYNAGNQRTSQTRVDGSVVAYGYDSIGQLKSATGIELDGTPRLHEKFGYGYDAAGNLQYRTNNALVQTFSTDSLNQLTSVARTNTITVSGTTSSQATSVSVNGSVAELYTDFTFAKEGITLTNGSNSFTAIGTSWQGTLSTNTVTVNLPATAGYTYDSNGNMTSDGNLGYDFDDENQLIRITSTNSWKSEFAYDAKGRRRIRTEYTWNGATWISASETRYVCDVMLVVQERNGTNAVEVSYTRGVDLRGGLEMAGGIGGLLARLAHSGATITPACYSDDGRGNVSTLSDTNQALVATYLYGPFNILVAKTGPMADANAYRSASKEVHMPSAMVYFGFRFYRPDCQRWLSRDPIGMKGGVNLYAYVHNSPIVMMDPCGNFTLPQLSQLIAIHQTVMLALAILPHIPIPVTAIVNEISPQGTRASMMVLCNAKVGRDTRDEAIRRGVDIHDTENGGNAYIHCVATCQSKRKKCPDPEIFWTIREEDPNSADTQADFKNNDIGFGIKGDCWLGCQDALSKGLLSCVTRDGKNTTPCKPPTGNRPRRK